MAHMIDESTGRAAIAYVGQPPWHRLGHQLQRGASIEEWTDKAGLGWDVLRSPVLFTDARPFQGPLPYGHCAIHRFPDREVLYRSDTGAPLGVVSGEYKPVQPKDVMGFFGDVAKLGKFELETAGALSGGRRIWGLARIHKGAPIIGQYDLVRPYLLLTTSFDGSMATTAKLTAIRVVCHNTLSVAVGDEHDGAGRAVGAVIKVNHAMKFDARAVRLQLGIFENAFERWMMQTKAFAKQEMDRETASRLAAELVMEIPVRTRRIEVFPDWALETAAYRRIMELFDGAAIGSELSKGTRWQFVNAVTQWIDHERGRDPAGRLNSAWYGPGEALKRRAYALAMDA